ncbi:hypothetical protein K435DRAFT_869091 [Dendrothele bispora CBS 962.96]|uniref:Uncharacterized protein n=1 Tax=Dendrothele bispora (strain CBS 962.96) TaxID=1314807 RepID=A0A4S8LA55_DENBC|nr:hypothetical protein K435DRAFT_869091 [Dendrothele bispora CBS 962.96]
MSPSYHELGTPAPRNSPVPSNRSSIRITQPLESRDQVTITFPPDPPGIRESRPPPVDTRTYQSQYESVMGSALDHNQPNTNSSQPKRYPITHDTLEDVGQQCRRVGEILGIRGVNQMQLSDHIQAVRALAEAREIDLPNWAASQLREPELN